MALYALCVHPLLRTLEDRLMGISIGTRGQKISVVAYADDVTIFITRREEIEIVNAAIRTYERASGAQLNPTKSRALAVGGWTSMITSLGIPLSQHVKILGVIFRSTLEATMQESWTTITTAVRVQARLDYARQLCLVHRVKYVITYLLSRIWYLAQILPPPARHVQQIMTACTWFIWRGAIFRVPATTLQRPTAEGGWALPDVAMKCRALLLDRMRTLAAEKSSVTAALLHLWDLADVVDNPPNVGGLPRTLAHVRHYALDMAYIAPTHVNEPRHKFRRRIYETIRSMHSNVARSEGTADCSPVPTSQLATPVGQPSHS